MIFMVMVMVTVMVIDNVHHFRSQPKQSMTGNFLNR